ncbi:MAG: hypothetical protein DMD72_10380 [Gemmatimonadetes bacterium]|nr:MAG: hypothetical protein DMD72_10380 [Gemmatimonadota bacterium]
MSRYTRFISASLVFALAACGGGTGPYGGGTTNQNPPPPPPGGTTVNATPSIAFTPATLTVDAGQAVTFAFGSVGHNVTFDTQAAGTPADIPGINSGVAVDRTFTTSGTYRYHCTIHPGMAGSIVVR